MSPRSEPRFRPPDETRSGAEAVLRFVVTLLAQLVAGSIAALVVLHYGNREVIGMLAAPGIAIPVVIGGLLILWLEHSCDRCIGTSPFLLLAEFWI